MSIPTAVVVGLGANLGPRRETLAAAVEALRRLARPGAPFCVSSLYETEPLGPPQPAFLNAAVLLHPQGSPPDLLAFLDALQDIEARHGRIRDVRWGPRTLDLDLLWWEGGEVNHPRLRVPHPELGRRAFALLPLLDVVPGAATPDDVSFQSIAQEVGSAGVVRVAGPNWVGAATTL